MEIPVNVRHGLAVYSLDASEESPFLLWSRAEQLKDARCVTSVWSPHPDLMRFFGVMDDLLRGAEGQSYSNVFFPPYIAYARHDDGVIRESPLYAADARSHSCRSLCRRLDVRLDRLVAFIVQDTWGSVSLVSGDGHSSFREVPGTVSVLSLERPNPLRAFVEMSVGLHLPFLDDHFSAIY